MNFKFKSTLVFYYKSMDGTGSAKLFRSQQIKLFCKLQCQKLTKLKQFFSPKLYSRETNLLPQVLAC